MVLFHINLALRKDFSNIATNEPFINQLTVYKERKNCKVVVAK